MGTTSIIQIPRKLEVRSSHQDPIKVDGVDGVVTLEPPELQPANDFEKTFLVRGTCTTSS